MEGEAPSMTPDQGIEECKDHVAAHNPAMTQFNDKFIAEEQRYIVKTNAGIIDQDTVNQFREAHVEA